MAKVSTRGNLKRKTTIKHPDGSKTQYTRTNLPQIAKVMTTSAILKTESNAWRDRAEYGYRQVARSYDIPAMMVDDQWRLLDRSLRRIENRWMDAVKNGTATERMATANIDRLSLASMIESSRQVYVTDQRRQASDYQQEHHRHREARLLSTTADEPDLEHALIEGTNMREDKVLAHLQRFGCKHSYEVIEEI